MFGIKSKPQRVHRRDDTTQQRRGLELAETLALQHVSEFVDLDRQLSKSIQLPPAPRTERVVGLAQRRDNVGQCLQRADDLLHQEAGRNQGKETDETKKRPYRGPGGVGPPEQDEGEHEGGSRNQQAENADAALERGVTVVSAR